MGKRNKGQRCLQFHTEGHNYFILSDVLLKSQIVTDIHRSGCIEKQQYPSPTLLHDITCFFFFLKFQLITAFCPLPQTVPVAHYVGSQKKRICVNYSNLKTKGKCPQPHQVYSLKWKQGPILLRKLFCHTLITHLSF